MYIICTRNELHNFENQDQARRFYREAARECEGAERDHYLAILNAIENETYSKGVMVYDFDTKNVIVYEYNKEENRLQATGQILKY